MQSPYWNVVIRSGSDAIINGMPVEMVVPSNVYSSVFQHLAGIARQLGSPVLARGVDETKGGQVAWFTVDADGQAIAAEPVVASVPGDRAATGVGPAPAPEPQPSPPLRSTSWAPPSTDGRPPSTNGWTPPVPRHAPPGTEEAMNSGPAVPKGAVRPDLRTGDSGRPSTPVRAMPPEPVGGSDVPVPPNMPPHLVSQISLSSAPSQVPQQDQQVLMNVPQPLAQQATASAAPPPSVLFVQPPKAVPQGGFRGAVYRLTAGRVNFGPNQTQLRLAERDARISRPLRRPYSTAFLSFKGGIGKTSTTVGVGLTLAQMRGAPPIAIDANPDSGDLAERMLGEEELLRIHPHSITDLVRDIPQVKTWTDLTGYIMQIDRLHVLAGEQDPAISDSLTAEGYTRVHDLVRHFFSVILTDCGTGVTHNAMKGILAKADNVVIAAGYAVSGAKRAASTLDWLAQHGYARLAQEALVVLTDKDGVSTRVRKDTVRDHLATHSRQVFVVPNDPAVADGDRINLARVHPRTREAWAEVAAAVIDGYR